MCGIAGLIVNNSDFSEQQHLLTRMMQLLAHRGPDGEGQFCDKDAGVFLGHKRLAIIDPEHAHQPMANRRGDIQLIFNGCIYNYEELARILRAKGHVFKSYSDTEMIVHAYEEWGESCTNKFNGMWAFALWDASKQKLFCSRDRIGIKPFYYHFSNGNFYFASEIKALTASGAVNAELNYDGLRQYLTFQYCLGSNTMFNKIYRLEPGYNLVMRPGGSPELSQYWDISFKIDDSRNEDYFVRKLRSLLEDAVRLRLRSDVPLGATLSGGLDSSSIVCMASALMGDIPMDTFTGAFSEGKDFNETHYAKIVSHHSGTRYNEIYLGAGNFLDSIEKIMWHMDEPAAGPGVFPQYWVSQLASERVKVCLGGQGGDEIFIGYVRYLIAYLEACLKGAIYGTAELEHYVTTLQSIIPNLRELENYLPMLKIFWQEGLFDDPAKRYFRLMNRFASCESMLSADLKLDHNLTFNEFSNIFDHSEAESIINRIIYFDLKTHLQSLLHVEDRTSMAHGLESRVPLLDHRIIELMSSISPVIKFKNGRLKRFVRKAVYDLLPVEVLSRKVKMGFPVPLNQWFAGNLGDFIHDILMSSKCTQRGIFEKKAIELEITKNDKFGRGLWGLLCLEIWFNQFIDK